ncbi:hypothetical protein K504DRAFT_454472 [Pleomassaria siparia CBS 279.74]|uniref:Uncharacterized protein n=1 Tax=Pleomassaria siparia CBS 279.74 TaxID=1314801 RepID=A0A6G1KBD7_9PLEO|nr:hypothetical protein K504DRAFT_454472 [Pleomassaria siparia CBS 279.74]
MGNYYPLIRAKDAPGATYLFGREFKQLLIRLTRYCCNYQGTYYSTYVHDEQRGLSRKCNRHSISAGVADAVAAHGSRQRRSGMVGSRSMYLCSVDPRLAISGTDPDSSVMTRASLHIVHTEYGDVRGHRHYVSLSGQIRGRGRRFPAFLLAVTTVMNQLLH